MRTPCIGSPQCEGGWQSGDGLHRRHRRQEVRFGFPGNIWLPEEIRMSLPAVELKSAIDELKALFGERLSTSTGVRDHHSKDESWHHPHRPDAVVFPNSTEEVAEIVRICARHTTPVVAYGTGTSLEG